MNELTEQIKRHEGLRLQTYNCPAGKLSIGYGHNLEACPVDDIIGRKINKGDFITKDEAERILGYDVLQAVNNCVNNINCYKTLSIPRQAVLVNMSFNLGMGKLLHFKKMLQALDRGDYEEASKQMLESKWAIQVGNRAIELANMMKEG